MLVALGTNVKRDVWQWSWHVILLFIYIYIYIIISWSHQLDWSYPNIQPFFFQFYKFYNNSFFHLRVNNIPSPQRTKRIQKKYGAFEWKGNNSNFQKMHSRHFLEQWGCFGLRQWTKKTTLHSGASILISSNHVDQLTPLV